MPEDIICDFWKLSNEILKQGSCLRFRARGSSMHPLIRDGGILVIEPIDVHKVRLGDVIPYRTGVSRMIAHRVIRRTLLGNRMTLLTKGDSCPALDQPIHPEDLLGKVTTIERNDRPIRFDSAFAKLVNLLWAKVSPFSPHVYPLATKVKRQCA